ncbi:MAG: CoA transferase [Burkholderiaceae bacterium]|jgi:itaconate CoA-transferase|nr:CoA transferase [Burkholderiaceae bacterium]
MTTEKTTQAVASTHDTQAPVRPLDGVTVVSLEHAIAAPFCTRQLADMGARVIKIERPNVGDFARAYDERVKGMSSHFVWTNRSKESLTLDLKHPDADAILQQLLSQADVFVQNLAPGAAKRMGLSFEVLHEKFPKLIVCDISGYGEGGPYETKKAYDLLIQSESGFVSVTGTADEPAKAGCSIADIAAGMYAYSSILNALLLRARTGLGSQIDVSMLESMVEWMGFPLYYAYDDAPQPPRAGAAHATIFPYGPFPVGDGNTVMLGLQNEREWQVFCEMVLLNASLAQNPLFMSNSKRVENRDVLRQLIVDALSDLSIEQVVARLESAQIANARVNQMKDVWAHPQLHARQRWVDVPSPVGKLSTLKPPATNQSFEARIEAIPALGEHTDMILTQVGCSDEQIAKLRQAGAI